MARPCQTRAARIRTWTSCQSVDSNQLNIDQIGALKNVDLHSRLASQNSGVFVSTKKDDVKLMKGSRLELALAEQGNPQQASTNR